MQAVRRNVLALSVDSESRHGIPITVVYSLLLEWPYSVAPGSSQLSCESNVQCVGWRFEEGFLQEGEEKHIKKSNTENEKDNLRNRNKTKISLKPKYWYVRYYHKWMETNLIEIQTKLTQRTFTFTAGLHSAISIKCHYSVPQFLKMFWLMQ